LGRSGPVPSGISDPSPRIASDKPLTSVETPPLSKYKILGSSKVFSGQGKRTAGPSLVDLNLPKMEGHRLIGVMAGSREHALAVVEETSTGIQKIAGIGQRLGPGVLVAVFLDRVVVDVGGQRRQLVMSDRTAEEMAKVLTLRREGKKPDRTEDPVKAARPVGKGRRVQASAPVGGGSGVKFKRRAESVDVSAGRVAIPEYSSSPAATGADRFD